MGSAEGFRIFLVACEPSGDALGAPLMRALRELTSGRVRFSGVGGTLMAAEGLRSIVPLRDLAVMGFAEVLPRLPLILRRQREVVDGAIAVRPHIVITIDSSSFNKRFARQLIRAGVTAPRLHYVAPMVWAWRPNRAHAMARLFDHLLTLFPFEPEAFEAAGLPTSYVGHPATESPPGNGAAFRARHGLDPGSPLLAVLPGSRAAEVRRLLPIFASAVQVLRRQHPDLRIVIPTVDSVWAQLRTLVADLPGTLIVTGEAAKRDAFAASGAALAASGTVTLELALAGVPMVVAYRPNPFSGWLASRLIKLPHVSLPNILSGKGLVPEMLRSDCRSDNLASAVGPLLSDGPARSEQVEGLALVRSILASGGASPSARAAEIALALASSCKPDQIRTIG